VRILGTFPVFSFFSHNLFSHISILHSFTVNYGQIVAIGATVLISWLNYIGVRRAGEFQFLFTLLKVAIIIGIVAVGFSYGEGTWANFATEFTGAKGGLAGFFAALVAALWAYDGWNDLTMVAGEIRNPQRNIPLALIWGVATVGALYILVNAAVQYVLPAAAIAGSERPASAAVALVLGHAGASLVSAGIAVSMLVTLNGTIMSGARVPFATARDGYFFKALAEVHPRFRTPSMAIVVQCALAIILLLLGGSFRQFFSLAIFAEWMFYMIAGSTVFVFRRREPQAERPYRVWGYPVVPAIFVVVSAALLYYTFSDNLKSSAGGCLAILAGVPVFYFFARRRAAAA
jgi:APA family basic amino acid/polyamine antiporter